MAGAHWVNLFPVSPLPLPTAYETMESTNENRTGHKRVNRWPAIEMASRVIEIPGSHTIVFDWDDTLLASTELSICGYGLDSNQPLFPELQAQLLELEHSVMELLTLSIVTGRTYIITNSEAGWVQISCRKWFPNVVPLLPYITSMQPYPFS